MVLPVPQSILYLAPELASQHAVLRAAAASGIDRVTFAIDGAVIGDAPASDPWLEWTLLPGRHVLRVSARLADGSLAIATSPFEVK